MAFIVGIDLSLTSTGIAAFETDTREMFTTAVCSTGHKKDPLSAHAARCRDMADRIIAEVDNCSPVMVVIESAYFNTGAADTSAHRRAGLWWAVITELITRYPVAEVAPSTLKKFVAGTGRASKEAMILAMAGRFGEGVLVKGSRDDTADAAGLAAMGGYAAGIESMPRTAARNATIVSVVWPAVESLATTAA